ncbi:MAG: hypothetical protein HKP58_14575 [Desulfatitalea sp.]|nr:hypothetical protein [Desulfatitalea sp.]NNK01631.1 hypothetical protein [Desulfatitalea sp.]
MRRCQPWRRSAATAQSETHPDEAPDQSRAGPAEAALLDGAALVNQLKDSAAGLKEICAGTEADFLNLGSALQTIQAESNTLTRMVVDILAVDKDQTISGALGTIQTHAANAIHELNLRREKLAEDLEGLKTIQADLLGLSKQNNSFKQVAKNLKMVGLNISIESARTDEAKAMFQALAEEITQLAQTVFTVAANVSNDTTTAQHNLESIQSDISSRMQHLVGLIDSAERTVQHALHEVENLMRLTMQVLDGISEKSQEISEQVGRLVVGIQIHDNISQRVAHIRSAIEEAVDIITTSTAIELPSSALRAVYGRVYGINRLQRTQLQIIREDVADTGRQSSEALNELLSAVQAVAQPEGFDLTSGGSICQFDISHNRHPVAVLRQALEQLISLFDEGVEDIRQLSAAREQTGQTIARMAQHIDHVRDINFDIHLKALNAVIKSTRLGDTGKAIEAIVNEMKELAEQSNTTIQSVTDIMQDIASASETMDESIRSDATDVDNAGTALRAGIDNFSIACTEFRTQSESAVDMGRQLQQKITQVRSRIGFFDDMLDRFNRYLDGLDHIDALLQTFADDVPDDWKKEEKNIKQRYTMQRELEAHKSAMKQASSMKGKRQDGKRPKALNDGTSADPSDGAWADNVELF